MQELRFVLIIVGIIAIAALLFHGLWSSKKEGNSKFNNKPLSNIDSEPELKDKKRKSSRFGRKKRREFSEPTEDSAESFDAVDTPEPQNDNPFAAQDQHVTHDPLIDAYQAPLQTEPTSADVTLGETLNTADLEGSRDENAPSEVTLPTMDAVDENSEAVIDEGQPEPEMQVLVLHVHCLGEAPFVGTQLFDSMQQNGLIFGEMNIFHRHADLSGNGKILFSVANMMQPGTLEHDDPDTFTTKGISFFMTLPCFGDAEQNFKLMLKTAQQIADDVSGQVLDEGRHSMTPDRLAKYRRQIADFKSSQA
ncbi:MULTISPECIES: cell division protein ZipA [unclassified Vibrio]|uniref:Cell division protein ZipA n=1 Tax=Vibrio sp. HB236076 TaxID=3232307 RepID=A0AB39HE96_9VIBR|nr:cell division protein ZipA [Vibrio sp. HB161653]MDP5254283.1 cell division protein ZipA [Vibrio sp. HB161653]